VVAEIAGLRRTAEGLSTEGWQAATTCAGWTAGDAAAHVAQSIVNQQRAFQNMLAGSTETPEWVEGVFVDAATTLDSLEASEALAVETMGRLTEQHADQHVPLPIGTFPTPTALDIILLEYGVHHWDVANAVDPTAELTAPAAAAVLGLAPAMFTFFAGPPPDAPLAYRLEAPTMSVDVTLVDGAWTLDPAPAGTPCTVVRGSDSAVALYELGRIGADDPRLQIDGADAATFKTWFPGP
jgi:uncharacterized protein (TIGR03083 family)